MLSSFFVAVYEKVLTPMALPGYLARHRTFVSNVAAMMSGKSVAAAIALFAMPVVARLYSPSDFGVAAAFLSIIGITSNIACLRYEMALVLPKENSEATALMALSYRILFAVSAAALLVLGTYSASGLKWPILEMLGYWMWLLPVGIFLMAGLQIQDQWLARKQAFRLVAASTVAGTVTNSGVRISVGALAGTSVLGLVSGSLLGLVSRFVVQRAATAEGARATFGEARLTRTRHLLSRYADFPKLNAPASLVFAFGQNLPVLFFGVMFSPAAAGFYAMANRLSQVPITVVAKSIRRVFLQKVAAIHNRGGSLRKAFLLTTGVLMVVGVVPFGCLWLFGQPLLERLLGDRWLEAGRYLEIMAPWILMLWVTAPANPIFMVLRKQDLWLIMQVCLTLLRLSAFGWGYVSSAGPEQTLQAFVAATVVGNLATIFVALMLISRHVPRLPPAHIRTAASKPTD